MAGLTCAQQLQTLNYRVLVVDKSRGLGGRVATRRLGNMVANHGLPYLTPQGQHTQSLIDQLLAAQIVQPATNGFHQWDSETRQLVEPVEPWRSPSDRHYIALDGMTAIAKWMAQGLNIWRNWRVATIERLTETWKLTTDTPSTDYPTAVEAKAIVVAIPAPQALALLQPLVAVGLPTSVVNALQAVTYAPRLTAIATYSGERQQQLEQKPLPWQYVSFDPKSSLSWVIWDSSHRPSSPYPVFVVHSSPEFAQTHFEANDLLSVGQQLLRSAADLQPWLAQPQTLQVHRWRYAIAQTAYPAHWIDSTLSPNLLCCGDWCGGHTVECALESGLKTAHQLHSNLQR